MLDSVGIRLPTYKVREMVLSMKDRGNLGEEELIDKLMFVQVKCLNNVQTVEDVIHIRTCMRTREYQDLEFFPDQLQIFIKSCIGPQRFQM